MKDLFGNEIPDRVIPKSKSEAFSKDNPMVNAHGPFWDPEVNCSTCENLFKKILVHTYFRCKLRRETGGHASDHKKTWEACSKYVKSKYA